MSGECGARRSWKKENAIPGQNAFPRSGDFFSFFSFFFRPKTKPTRDGFTLCLSRNIARLYNIAGRERERERESQKQNVLIIAAAALRVSLNSVVLCGTCVCVRGQSTRLVRI